MTYDSTLWRCIVDASVGLSDGTSVVVNKGLRLYGHRRVVTERPELFIADWMDDWDERDAVLMLTWKRDHPENFIQEEEE